MENWWKDKNDGMRTIKGSFYQNAFIVKQYPDVNTIMTVKFSIILFSLLRFKAKPGFVFKIVVYLSLSCTMHRERDKNYANARQRKRKNKK